MTTRRKVLIGGCLVLAAAVTAWLAFSAQEELDQRIREITYHFLDVTPQSIEKLTRERRGRHQHRVEVSYTPAPSDQQSVARRASLDVDTQLGYVTRARWPEAYVWEAKGDAAGEHELLPIARRFAERHCPFWTEQFTLEEHRGFPRNEPSAYLFTWLLRAEDDAAIGRVMIAVCAQNKEVFSYACSYAPPEQMTTASVTRMEAMRTARELLTDRHGAAAQIDDVTFSHHMKKYDAPVWTIDFHVSQEGMETWYDAVFIDARNGKVLYPTDEY
ncbi:MAG: hypothetical protein U9R79_07535 [Armatimonadota bacterium]|nr:hypothetical protein [Armatimonadota bacterium]